MAEENVKDSSNLNIGNQLKVNNDKETAAPQNEPSATNTATFLILLIIAFLKDALEMAFSFVPFLNIVGVAISFLFSTIIYVILLLSHKLSLWKNIGFFSTQLLDALPYASFLPTTTIYVLAMLLMDKTKVGQKLSKITSLIPSLKKAK